MSREKPLKRNPERSSRFNVRWNTASLWMLRTPGSEFLQSSTVCGARDGCCDSGYRAEGTRVCSKSAPGGSARFPCCLVPVCINRSLTGKAVYVKDNSTVVRLGEELLPIAGSGESGSLFASKSGVTLHYTIIIVFMSNIFNFSGKNKKRCKESSIIVVKPKFCALPADVIRIRGVHAAPRVS
jgi:hypothetical protein